MTNSTVVKLDSVGIANELRKMLAPKGNIDRAIATRDKANELLKEHRKGTYSAVLEVAKKAESYTAYEQACAALKAEQVATKGTYDHDTSNAVAQVRRYWHRLDANKGATVTTKKGKEVTIPKDDTLSVFETINQLREVGEMIDSDGNIKGTGAFGDNDLTRKFAELEALLKGADAKLANTVLDTAIASFLTGKKPAKRASAKRQAAKATRHTTAKQVQA